MRGRVRVERLQCGGCGDLGGVGVVGEEIVDFGVVVGCRSGDEGKERGEFGLGRGVFGGRRGKRGSGSGEVGGLTWWIWHFVG